MPSGRDPHHPGHKRRRRIRDTSEVSCCLKYVIFGFNVIFWLLGLGVLAIGIWAWTEKDTFNNLSKLTNIALDPAFIFIWGGAITFVIGNSLPSAIELTSYIQLFSICWVCWGPEREHGAAGGVCHLPGHPPPAGNDLWHPGLHLQRLDQGPGLLGISGIHCPLQVRIAM